jgi:competence protein ComEA
MPDLPRSHLIAYGLALLAVLVLGFRHIGGHEAAAASSQRPLPISIAGAGDGGGSGSGRVVVHVAGAVQHPGVYRLPAGARVDDAVRRAGGARPRADLDQLNLAAKLEDGRQVLVPRRMPASTAAAGPVASTGGAVPGTPAVPINLNTATLEQLDTLPGIGPATAQKILDYRTAHGGFGSVEDLGQVPGIGDRRMAALRDEVRV